MFNSFKKGVQVNCSKRKLKQIVKKLIIRDFNYCDLTRKSKIDDLKFYDDLLFDFLTMFLFRTDLEEELDLQIEFNEDEYDYVKMTVNEFVDTVYELIKDSNIKGLSNHDCSKNLLH